MMMLPYEVQANATRGGGCYTGWLLLRSPRAYGVSELLLNWLFREHPADGLAGHWHSLRAASSEQ